MSASDYEYQGGKTRRYLNTKTGETISRRQYDQRFGRLAASGLTFEKQARANLLKDPALSMARPARGRKSAIPKPAKPAKVKPAPLSDARKKQLAKIRAKALRQVKNKQYITTYRDGSRINIRIPFDGTELGARNALMAVGGTGKSFDYVRVVFGREGGHFSSTEWFFNPFTAELDFKRGAKNEEQMTSWLGDWQDRVESKMFLLYGGQGEVVSAELHLYSLSKVPL